MGPNPGVGGPGSSIRPQALCGPGVGQGLKDGAAGRRDGGRQCVFTLSQGCQVEQ